MVDRTPRTTGRRVHGRGSRRPTDGAEEELLALRLTRDVAATPLEIKVLKEALAEFVEPAAEMGLAVSDDQATIKGPALWLEPIAEIAVFR